METQIIIEVLNKLIGEIEPQGETNIDNKRFQNLKTLSGVLEYFTYKIHEVSRHKDRAELSMKRAGIFASEYIKENLEFYGNE